MKHKEYKETLYQWIWQNLEFDCQSLKTLCGKPVRIVSNGTINHGAGPDFLGATIWIGEMKWHGAVEIHRKTSDWQNHHHQSDPMYNCVILHVVFQNNIKNPVVTPSGFVPYTLCLEPYIHSSLYKLAQMKENSGLACAGTPVMIHQEAFMAQIHKANREYLTYKVDELLKDYPAGVPISEAWKSCTIKRIYHTLGIPLNRQQMWQLSEKAILLKPGQIPAKQFVERVNEIAFIGIPAYEWVHTGMRPASRPAVRIRQAAYLHHAIEITPFHRFLSAPETVWAEVMKIIPAGNKPGRPMRDLLRHTVLIPAMYLLGELLHSTEVKNWANEQWNTAGLPLPDEVTKPFSGAGYQLENVKKMPGLAHQLKRYCRARNCHHCEVFKKAIGS